MKPRTRLPVWAIPRLLQANKVGIFSNFGPQVRDLEVKFANFFGVDVQRVSLVANATLALQGLIQISGRINWEIPSWTFAATAQAGLGSGKKIRFVDVSSSTWMSQVVSNPDSNLGQLTVLPFGSSLSNWEWGNSTEVVVDAAASLGSISPHLIQRLPEATSVVFSLHATKVLGVGEGALVVFGSSETANHFKEWTNFGFSGSRSSAFLGTNAKMSEYVACLLHLELDNWKKIHSEWALARKLIDRVSEDYGIECQPGSQGLVSPYWIANLGSEERRSRAEAALAAREISTRRWWEQGCHKMQAFLDVPRGSLQVTEDLASKTLGLPFFRGITEGQVQRIARTLSPVLRQ